MTNAQRIEENTGRSPDWIKKFGHVVVRLKVDAMGNYVNAEDEAAELFAQEGTPLWYDVDAEVKQGTTHEAYDMLHKGWDMDVMLTGDFYEAWSTFHA